MYPISLKIVISTPIIRSAFLDLQFVKSADLKWTNDLGSTYKDLEEIKLFVVEFKQKNKGAELGEIEFQTIIQDHYQDMKKALEDVRRCFKIIDTGKDLGAQFTLSPIVNRLDTPYIHIFETLISWSRKGHKLSLYEYIALPLSRRYNRSIETIYQDHSTWDDECFMEMIRTIETYPDLREYAMRRWKTNYLEITKIDWVALRQYTQYA